jgi:pyruvate-ferredoxin/flavodoxin oxidoreductase
VSAIFYGLGADGTVGANKNTVKIVGEHTDLHAQGYFVYDSKKSGAQTVSHLRFSREPIRSTYLIDQADLVACHQFGFLMTREVLDRVKPGGTFLLNSPFGAEHVWDALPEPVQRTIIDKALSVHVIDAQTLARELGLGGRINTVMQACFFRLSGTLPWDVALEALQDSVRSSYGRYGREVVERNLTAIDHAVEALAEVEVPDRVTTTFGRRPVVPEGVPDFVERVTGRSSPARATCCRSARCRSTGPSRPTRRATRSGPSPRRSRSGTRHLHRLRQVRHRLPARRHQDEGVRAGPPRRRARRLPEQGLQGA